MILTGNAIVEAVNCGDIVIDPFNVESVNPNSYNYKLGPDIYVVEPLPGGGGRRVKLRAKDGRILLKKGALHLGHTYEKIGSRKYVTSLIGRSSVGRLGIFVQVSANLGHMGAIHRWTLEIVTALDVYVYPGQTFGQVSFWSCVGQSLPYQGWFGQHDEPMPSKFHQESFQREYLSESK